MGGVVPSVTRRRRRATGGVVAVVAAASLAVAGCGGQASTGAGASEVAGFIPAGSPVYVELSTDLSGAQWTQTIALAKRFPGYGDLLAEAAKGLASEKLDFQGQIKPLLGSSAALGVFDVKGVDGSSPDASVVGAIDLADGKEADFIKFAETGDKPSKKVGQHDGVDLYGDGEMVFGIVEGTVVLSDTEARVNRAIDAHRGGSSQTMAGSAKLATAFAELPDEVLAQGFVDVGAFMRIVGSATDGDLGAGGGKALADQLQKSGLGADAAIGLSLSSEADGVRVKAVATGVENVAGQTAPFTPKLVDNVPADAIAYLGLHDLFGMGAEAIKQIGAQDPEVKSALGQAGLILPLLGVNLDDIKGLTSLEHALVVTKGAKVPGVVLALEVADGAKAGAVLDTLSKTAPSLLEKSGASKIPPFTKVALANGVSGWQSAISPEAGVVYGVDKNLALIGTLPEAVKQVQAPTSRLTDDPAYQAATRQMPDTVSGLLWLNGEELLTTLDALGALKNAPADAIANIRPLKNIAAWSTGGAKPTFELFLTIK